MALLPAPMIGTAVQQDPVQPRAKPIRIAQHGQVPPSSDQGVLGGVLGRVGVAQDSPAVPTNRSSDRSASIPNAS